MTFVYVEKEIEEHFRTKEVLKRLKPETVISISRFTEIFNRKNQHFRLQKKQTTYILAKKHGTLVYETPPGYGIGAKKNYYFSHLLNCPFDCRYCFLQGFYRSAAFVLFINYEEFQESIEKNITGESTTFFSGYDGDSLAMEGKTGFLASFLPFFKMHPQIELELRTKSIRIHELLALPPIPNVIIAYSLNPQPIVAELETKTPSLEKRLDALVKLQKAGWKIGLRFDPIIECTDFENHYTTFFDHVFSQVDETFLHSVTLGGFRLPKPIFKEMKRLKPRDPLLALHQEDASKNHKLKFCKEKILQHTDTRKLFSCQGAY